MAVVFDDEVLDGPIPVEAHDRRVAGVLTPGGGLRWFGDAHRSARYNHPTDGAPTGRSAAVLPRPRGAGARALARARRLPRVAAPPRGRASRGSSTRGRRPPTAGPGSHHVLARVFKDIFPRYQTMRGYLRRAQGRLGLPRPAGRDRGRAAARHHVEGRDRGLRHRRVQRASAASRSSTYLEDWDALTERIGFWVDLDDAYRTLDPTLHRVGLVGAAHDLGQGPALRGPQGRPLLPALRHGAVQPRGRARLPGRRRPVRLRALPGRRGRRAAAGRRRAARLDDDAVDARRPTPRSRSTPSSPTCARKAGRRARRSCSPRRSSSACSARSARDPRPLPRRRARRRALRAAVPVHAGARPTASAATPCCSADFVTADDGTGLVHTAIAFGEDDFRLGAAVRPQRRQPGAARRHLRRAHRPVRRALRQGRRRRPRSRTSARAAGCCAPRSYEHAYPHCWRCGTPLLYYAKPSWYIATSKLRDRLLAANETVDWHPTHIKHGRFGDWLRGQRRLGALARALLGHAAAGLALRGRPRRTCIGSFDELEELSGVRLEDPHRPVRRRRRLPVPECSAARCRACPRSSTCGSTRARCRSRSGTRRSRTRSASRSASRPTSSARRSTRRAAGSTRCSPSRTLLFDRAPYENVVCLGLILDARGPEDVASRKGNVVVPWDVLDRYGADAFRWYFFTSKQPWDGYRFSLEAIGEGVRLFLLQLWNTYALPRRCTSAPERRRRRADRARPLDPLAPGARRSRGHRAPGRLRRDDRAAARSRPSSTTSPTGTCAARGGASGTATRAAFATLRDCLVTVAQLLAPFTPFVADEIYDNLDGTEPIVHLSDWPERRPSATSTLEAAMAVARETVRLGLRARAARRRSRCASRCARPSSSPPGASARRSSGSPTSSREELNVKALRFVDAGRRARLLRGQAQLPHARPALRQARCRRSPRPSRRSTPRTSPRRCARARTVGVDDRRPRPRARRRRPAARDAAARGLPARARGLARGRARAARSTTSCAARASRARSSTPCRTRARRPASQVEDRIALTLGGDEELLAAAREHEPLRRRRDARDARRLRDRQRRGRAGDDRGPRAADRRRARRRRLGVTRGHTGVGSSEPALDGAARPNAHDPDATLGTRWTAGSSPISAPPAPGRAPACRAVASGSRAASRPAASCSAGSPRCCSR